MSDPSLVGVNVSPTTTVYSGPPPPYSYSPTTAHATTTTSVSHPHLLSPADSRRTSGDDKDTSLSNPPPTSTRQSLPSIAEALKSGASFAYALPVTTAGGLTGSPRPTTHVDGGQHSPPTTIIGASDRTRQPSPPHPARTTEQTTSIQSHDRYQPPPAVDSRRISLPAIVPPDHRFPSLPPLRTGPSTAAASTTSGPPPIPPSSATHFTPSSQSDLPPPPPHHPAYSPRLERTPTSATNSMNPTFPYVSYPPPHHLYPPPPPPPPPPIPPVQQPRSPAFYPPVGGQHPLQHASTPTYPPPPFVEREPPRPVEHPGYRNGVNESHGTSVKRHLEFLDVEASLKEVADSGARLVDFSRDYGHRARDLLRTGPLPGMLPSIAECDEMIRHQQRIQDLLGRLREMLVTEQTAVLHRRVQQQERPGKGDFEMEDPSGTNDEKANVLPADARKRRGRAAPPGRCHSCNRAETPEWRRGPDGARTLCNACGLHYAKLTRKQGPKGAQGHSSLRPKPMGPASHPT
ncbi:MAG: hypothetical protein M1823_001246 [Watsoniomyces obsoletus]|nr:MAG: hypothetical protein M1823_001246 [Watsoniomyces obsoletus]